MCNHFFTKWKSREKTQRKQYKKENSNVWNLLEKKNYERNYYEKLYKIESAGQSSLSSVLIVTMAGSIKLFQFIQKTYQTIGISPSKLNSKKCSINPKNTAFLIFLTQYTLTTVGFLMFDAYSMFDFGFAFFNLLSIINPTVIYLLFIWKLENTLNFIEKCEIFIAKSKYPKKFNKIISWSNKFCAISQFQKTFFKQLFLNRNKLSQHIHRFSW